MEDITKECRRYISSTWALVALLYGVANFVEKMFPAVGCITLPACISGVFVIIVGTAVALIWKKVASSAPDMLTTFHQAVSGFRMLLALAVLFVCYLKVGRDEMGPYIIIFMVFYLVYLAYHTIFFARINNK